MTGDPRQRRTGRPSIDAISADPYTTLGLPSGAPLSEVKRAYRRLAKAFHPDSAGAEALPRFLAIHAAYERIATGRVLPGASGSAASASPVREPWRADPARARATRQRAAGRASTGRGGTTPGSSKRAGAAENADGAGRGGEPRERSGGRRGATRKATLGSTSYDDARDRADATWGGASWYGPTTGEYWIINPREYADPRKHGPAYQARVRQAAEAPAGEASAEAAPAESASAQSATADFTFEHAAPRSRPAAPAGEPRSRAEPPSGRQPVVAPERPRVAPSAHPGDHARAMPSEPDTAEDGARWPLLGGPAASPFRRLRLALVAWPPLGVAAAIGAADATGCAVASVSCSGLDPMLPWLAQVAILALLLLLPPLARLLAFGTIAVLLALVPATALLLAFGAGGAPQAGFALGTLLALAWLAGVTYAAASGVRRSSLSSAR